MISVDKFDLHLPHDEQAAIELVSRVGLEEVTRRYDAICAIARARYDRYAQTGDIPVGFTPLNYLNNDELKERHTLFLGISLCSNPQFEARQRVLKRLTERSNRIRH